ncbi:MAG: hypothetical protein EZS28_016738 [Streblomastix strix]|uniref:Uncharacterized protein n=1 Tax=Streblomastix strix TaxID=222440 RepID=A0A5J4VZP4_9EUKA|nr:MAG: hypothetical protein EZS28_016738 [Streblomastix strix]
MRSTITVQQAAKIAVSTNEIESTIKNELTNIMKTFQTMLNLSKMNEVSVPEAQGIILEVEAQKLVHSAEIILKMSANLKRNILLQDSQRIVSDVKDEKRRLVELTKQSNSLLLQAGIELGQISSNVSQLNEFSTEISLLKAIS